ncbi:CLUMA_CG017738, isoform A [Clunio marinus]|uniref:CLUMA_CG017738, isoform A n=1 Tax=Clunio marinus TaxID=568069 RepID=A0A1J1IY95_9DIPT|nr:CLUMA_CG017738, isoform A [Clunio marinus]
MKKMYAKLFLIIFFVIISFNQINCNYTNNDISNGLNEDHEDSNVNESCPCEGQGCHPLCMKDEDTSLGMLFMLTASQVILATAIIMGISAVITIILRVCSRTRFQRNTQNLTNIPDEFQRTGIRASLTSLQQRVMSKLRDRPPRYETRHNYEFQRRQRNNTRIPILNPGAVTSTVNIPPPAYEVGDNNSASELPPTYTIAIEDTGGVLNQPLPIDERETTNENDISRNRTTDNVLHI